MTEYKLHGAIQTFHYQFPEPKREPNSDTLLYLPFTEDILDHSGKNHTVTVSGNNYSFTTFSDGNKCMNLNSGGGTTYFSVSGSDILWDYSTTSATWAYKISEMTLNSGGSWASTHGFNYNTQTGLCQISQVTASGYDSGQMQIPGGRELYGSSNSGTTHDSRNIKANTTEVHSIVFTFDVTTKTFKTYLDGVLFYENVFTAGPSRSSAHLYIWRDPYDSDGRRYLRAKIAHMVYELGVRDAERIQLYNELGQI